MAVRFRPQKIQPCGVDEKSRKLHGIPEHIKLGDAESIFTNGAKVMELSIGSLVETEKGQASGIVVDKIYRKYRRLLRPIEPAYSEICVSKRTKLTELFLIIMNYHSPQPVFDLRNLFSKS